MLYFIGGAARSGKSLISRKFMMDTGIPYFSLDVLMMGLANGLPEYGINPEDPDFQNADKIWPVLRSMCINMIETGLDSIIEGVTIAPKHVNELQTSYPEQIKSCFIGYAHTLPEEKLKTIRKYSDSPNNWATGYSDQQILELINRTIRYSTFLEEECVKFRIRYFDQSEDFLGTIEEVITYLKN